VRVERAKELLISTGLTNERIGKEVGFGSSLSFVRTFRKLEGVSPAEYRKIKAKRGAS
jgi:two-component system response regulator YesN